MRIESACSAAFARHESFHPRYGWIKKSVEGASDDPNLFTREDAVVTLGVGKNMVRAIRYWGLATKVLANRDNPANARVPHTAPSRIGRTLLADDGWDPYVEDPATLWLLHWLLMAPNCLAPVWWAAFNEFTAVQFRAADLEAFIVDYIGGVAGWDSPQVSSLKKDVACLLRMYTALQDGGRATDDDAIDCPFRELGLLRVADDRRTYRFVVGGKPSLPPAVALYACLDFAACSETGASTVTLSRLATEPGSPGRVFKVSEPVLTELLTSACRGVDDLDVINVAGAAQLAFRSDPGELAGCVLYGHYRKGNAKALKPRFDLAGLSARTSADDVLALSGDSQ
ncbi:Protein of unknown function [Geodermatophilus obscurus]|uniref:DUF4007 domain-containing protein n=1 Tax=Geodermatophilus obscurus TaxID=1861 RepID=A0A1M7S2D0_9ACTN|nr:DUF4007 family protein [Geodermatophilus obscurus]SHN52799.1 Protein of unknown function [Geodermatophilus obscurus]